jgi:hypothetical protein
LAWCFREAFQAGTIGVDFPELGGADNSDAVIDVASQAKSVWQARRGAAGRNLRANSVAIIDGSILRMPLVGPVYLISMAPEEFYVEV